MKGVYCCRRSMLLLCLCMSILYLAAPSEANLPENAVIEVQRLHSPNGISQSNKAAPYKSGGAWADAGARTVATPPSPREDPNTSGPPNKKESVKSGPQVAGNEESNVTSFAGRVKNAFFKYILIIGPVVLTAIVVGVPILNNSNRFT